VKPFLRQRLPFAACLGAAAVTLVVASSASSRAVVAFAAQAGDKAAAGPSYTEEQSKRGEAVYTKSCGFCHEDQSMAPPLQGDGFLKSWSDKTAGALFDKIQMTMPLNEPGTMSDQQSADLVAYILKLNHFPAGQEPLAHDAAALNSISLAPK
jgi:quinoprotein glucose dehydrogenase